MFRLIYFPEALRFLRFRIRRGIHGYHAYAGDAEHIAEQIIGDCWNAEDRFFQTSANHYPQFFSRDFGMITESLLHLGYREKVKDTLLYALSRFQKAGRVTAVITPRGIPFDYFGQASDSLPFLTRSLVLLDDPVLIQRYHAFLSRQASSYFHRIIDPKTGLPKKGLHLVGMRDHAVRDQGCYATCMAGMLKQNLQKLHIESPLQDNDYGSLLLEHYWKEDRFLDDLSGYTGFTGDANLMPFYTGIINDKDRFRQVKEKMKEYRLEQPFPLRYFNEQTKEHRMFWTEFFVPNWEMDTVWGHLGMMFLETVARLDPEGLETDLVAWKRQIEKDQTFIEVHHPDGKPYRSLFYAADEGMSWAAIFLRLWRNHGKTGHEERVAGKV
ncbi:MAG: hypothetical protein GXP63_02265 [DPANN group archaeon]|nr:hypothetical protein [DPANN group archaeon]